MKNVFQKILGASLLLFLFLGFSACSKTDELKEVREYNNAIIAIQEKMLMDVSDTTSALSNRRLKVREALPEVEKMQTIIQQNFDQFKEVKVPKGAEDLNAAMQNFFEVETANGQLLGNAYANLLEHENDRQLRDNLTSVLETIASNENQALAHFDEVQKQVAKKYSETVEGK